MLNQEILTYVDFSATREATIATITLNIDGVIHSWDGTAKKCPGDGYSLEVGRNLAVARALRKASRYFEKQGNGLVKCADDNHMHSLRARKLRPTRKKPSGITKSKKKLAEKTSPQTDNMVGLPEEPLVHA